MILQGVGQRPKKRSDLSTLFYKFVDNQPVEYRLHPRSLPKLRKSPSSLLRRLGAATYRSGVTSRAGIREATPWAKPASAKRRGTCIFSNSLV